MSDKETKDNKATDLVELCRILTTQNYIMKTTLKHIALANSDNCAYCIDYAKEALTKALDEETNEVKESQNETN